MKGNATLWAALQAGEEYTTPSQGAASYSA